MAQIEILASLRQMGVIADDETKSRDCAGSKSTIKGRRADILGFLESMGFIATVDQ